MLPMTKVECVECGGKYYIATNDINSTFPDDINPGEAFPYRCPLCNDGRYAVLPEEK